MQWLQLKSCNQQRCNLLLATMVAALISVNQAFCQTSALQRGLQAENVGNFEESVPLFRQAISDDPAFAKEAREHLYPLLIRFHRYDEAQQIVDDLISTTHNSEYRATLARLLQASGQFYAAQRQWQEILSLQPNDAGAIFGIGQCLEATGNYDAAKDYYRRVAGDATKHGGEARARLEALSTGKSAACKIDADVPIATWSRKRMPIKVFIDDGSGVIGYRHSYGESFANAVEQWNRVANGAIVMQRTNDKEGADIVVDWAPSLGHALGVTQPEKDKDNRFVHVHIGMAVNVDQSGRELPAETPMTQSLYEAHDRMMHDVSLHELGHALGLQHSAHSNDIMANGVYGLNAQDIPTARDLQPGDISRLMRLYADNEETAASQSEQKTTVSLSISDKRNQDGTVGNLRQSVGKPTSISIGSKFRAAQPMDPTEVALDNAIFSMNSGDSVGACETLNDLIRRDPRNAKAHYLLAVAYVALRQYDKASDQYRTVLKLVSTGKLADLANVGLAKIGH